MLSLHHSVFSLLLLNTLTGINCEELTPVKTEEFTSEHTSVSLSYKYHTTIAVGDDFFWYRQHPGKPPEFLIYISGSNFTKPADSLKKKRFFTQLSEDKHGVKLQINSAAVTDSAVYYCAVRPTVTGNTTNLYKNTTSTRGSHILLHLSGFLCNSCEDDITANRAAVFSAEGQTVSLSCNYSVKAENLQWYRQDPGSAPHYLLMITDTKEPEVLKAAAVNSRLTAELNQERNQVYLQINSAAVTDSAVYYCAV
uniref:uncharacterized protein LOC122768274 n=1 Tax=Solea senegalensis TaxID=28829 RepID=UPI001CD81D34